MKVIFVSLILLGLSLLPSFGREVNINLPSKETKTFDMSKRHSSTKANRNSVDIDEANISGHILTLELGNGDETSINLFNYHFYEIQAGDVFGYSGIEANCLDFSVRQRYMPIKLLFKGDEEGSLLDVSLIDTQDKIIYSSLVRFTKSEFNSLQLPILQLNETAKNDILQQKIYFFKYSQYVKHEDAIKSFSIGFENNSGSETSSYEEECERMTSYSSILDNYNPIDNDLDSYGYITGNQITELIPERCFTEEGEYFYIGKEYGFVVKTVTDGATITLENKHQSLVAIFSIDITLPGNLDRFQSEIEIKVVPKVFGTFKHDIYEDDYYWRYNGFSSSVDELIYFSADAPYLSLANISFGVSLQNANESNIGDSNYVSELDNGDYIIQTRYNYNGYVIEEEESESTLIQDVQIVLSYLPVTDKIMAAIDAFTLATDFFNFLGIGQPNLDYIQVVGDNEANIKNYPHSALEQRQIYGGLLKTMYVIPKKQYFKSDENSTEKYNPTLFKDHSNYAQAKISTIYANNNIPSNETKLTYAIGLDVCDRVVDPIFMTPKEPRKLMSFLGVNFAPNYQMIQKEITGEEIFTKNYKLGETIRFIYASDDDQYQLIKYKADGGSILRIYENKQLYKELNFTEDIEIVDNLFFSKNTDYYFEFSGFNNNGNLQVELINSQIIELGSQDIYIDSFKKRYAVCVQNIKINHNGMIINKVAVPAKYIKAQNDSVTLSVYTLEDELYSSGNPVKSPGVIGGEIIDNDLVKMFYLEISSTYINFSLHLTFLDYDDVMIPIYNELILVDENV